MVLGQVILLASEAVPSLLWSCIRSSIGANSDWGTHSCRQN